MFYMQETCVFYIVKARSPGKATDSMHGFHQPPLRAKCSPSCTQLRSGKRSVGRLLCNAISFMTILLPVLAVVLSLPAQAQVNSDPLWTLFQNKDGVASNDVWSTLVTEDGVWLGTDIGISRYDGAWTNFVNDAHALSSGEPRTGFVSGWVVELAMGDNGVLWAGTNNGEISRWDGQDWRATFVVDGPLFGLLESKGKVYVATENGLFVYDPATDGGHYEEAIGSLPVLSLYADEDDLWVGTVDGMRLLRDDIWRTLRLPENLDARVVTAIVVDEDDRVWIGTPEGVTWFDPAFSEWLTHMLPIADERGESKTVFALATNDNVVWAASDGGGARKFLARGATVIDLARSGEGGLTTPLIRDIAIAEDGEVWFATPVGPFRFQQQMWLNEYLIGDNVDRYVNNINDMLVSSDGTIWIATGGAGIRSKEPRSNGYFETLYSTASSDIPNNGINTLEEDHAGGIWAGTFRGPTRFDGQAWDTPISISDLPSAVVTDFLPSDFGVWIGTEAGLVHYDLEHKTTESVAPLADTVIESLARDAGGRVWVGTASSGIWIGDGDEWQPLHATTPDGVPIPGVSTGGSARDPAVAHGMWALVPGRGLLYYNGTIWEVINVQDFLPSNIMYRLFTDGVDGSLWIGGEGGVSHFDGTTWGTFTVDQGLQSTAVFAIAAESTGAYWFGGPEGLSRYTPDTSVPWIRISAMDNVEATEEGDWSVAADLPLTVRIEAGDLHTDREALKLFYRLAGDADWLALTDDQIALSFPDAGGVGVELMARDQAFNFSDVTEQRLTVLPPPDLIMLPLLGEVERGVFYALLILGSSALLGFGYVSFEIVQGRMRSIEAVNRGYNPYVSGEPIRREDMFFGRKDLLQRIVDTLHNNSIMIHGERRIGKTTLLYQLSNALREVDDPDFCFVPVYVDLEGTTENEFFHYLIEEIALGVLLIDGVGDGVHNAVSRLRYHSVNHFDYSDRDFNVDLRCLLAELQEWIESVAPVRNLRLILLMDEMDVMSQYDHLVQQQLRRIFMRDFASSLGAVVAGIQISKEWDRVESPWYNLFNEIAVQPFSREQALDLLIEPVRDVYRYDPAALEFVIEHSDGRPFRIQQYALEAVNHMLQQRRRRITLADVEVAHDHIESNFDDLLTQLTPLPQDDILTAVQPIVESA